MGTVKKNTFIRNSVQRQYKDLHALREVSDLVYSASRMMDLPQVSLLVNKQMGGKKKMEGKGEENQPNSLSFPFPFPFLLLLPSRLLIEGVVAPWCNPLTLQPEQSGGVGSNPGRAPPLERHDKGSRTRLGLFYLCAPSAWG